MINLKNKKKNGISILVSLCLLGLGSVLISNSVFGAGNGAGAGNKDQMIGGFEDIKEVVKKAVFTKRGETGVIAEMEMNEDGTLEIKSTVVVSGGNRNQVNNDSASHILGGSGNTIKSNNITILGGKNLTVENNSQNSTLIGGNANTGKSELSIIVGGEKNIIDGGSTSISSIVGGEGNNIKSNNSTVIGSNNSVEGKNSIVAGNRVEVSESVNNIFVFSNNSSTFQPQSSGTFYINASSGLGLNGDAFGMGISSHGAIKVGYIDIDSIQCNAGLYGVQGIAGESNCLVGCAKTDDSGKWSLLDKSQQCIKWCETNSNCTVSDNDNVEYESTEAVCTGSADIETKIYDGKLAWCGGLYYGEYRDTIFTYDIVDICPTGRWDNPCTYTCGSGTTWGEKSKGDGNYGCWASCDKVIDGKREIGRNGDILRRYVVQEAVCDQIGKACDRNLKRWRCKDGTWTPIDGYNLKNVYNDSCVAQPSPDGQCKKSDDGTRATLADYGVEPDDRQRDNGKLIANYEECDTYSVNNESCVQHQHYKFIGCITGYTLDRVDGSCQKDCNFHGTDVPYGKTITGYEANPVTCTSIDSKCSHGILKCEKGGNFSSEFSQYKEASCALTGLSCGIGFDVSECPTNGICDTCTGYIVNNNACQAEIKKKLIACDTGYSVYIGDNSCKKDCELPRGGTLKHGKSVDGYKKDSVTCSESCDMNGNKVSLICNQGKLSGKDPSYYTGYYSGCVTQPLPNKAGYDIDHKVANAICEGFTGYTVVNNHCEKQPTTYKCTGCEPGYTQIGSGNEMKCIKNCSFVSLPSMEIISLMGGESILTYNNNSYTCPKVPQSKELSCTNGVLHGGYYIDKVQNGVYYTGYYTGYSLSSKTCQTAINIEGVKIFTSQIHHVNAEYYTGLGTIGICTEHNKLDNTTCETGSSYYYYTCKDGYRWNNAGTKCVKCEGTIPDNAIINNNLYPSDDSVSYYYSGDVNAVCSFRCKPDYVRSGNISKCVSNNKKCSLDNGTKTYNHGTQQTFYKSDSILCNDKCESIVATCNNGVWMDSSNSIVDNGYTTCKTITSKQVKNKIINERGARMEGECDKYYTGDSEALRTFIGEFSIANTDKQSICREYKSSNRSCDNGRTYTTFMCNGTWEGDVCVPGCVLGAKTYKHGEKADGYKESTKCGQTCPKITATCSGGAWYYSGALQSSFKSECQRTEYTCSSLYKLDYCPTNGKCRTCTGYTVTDNICKPNEPKRFLLGCEDGYEKNKAGTGCVEKGCTLPEGGEVVPHNTEITRYQQNTLQCSSDQQECPSETRVCNKGRRYKKNSTTPSDFPGGYKYQSCSLNATQCDRSVFNIVGPAQSREETECQEFKVQNGKCVKGDVYHSEIHHASCWAEGVEYSHGGWGYFYQNARETCPTECTADWYQCDDGEWKKDGSAYNGNQLKTTCKVDGSSTCETDESIIFDSYPDNAEYETCYDYNAISETSCNRVDKYKFKKCNEGYTEVTEDGKKVCKKNCSVTLTNLSNHTEIKTIKHGSGIWAYGGNPCNGEYRECDDGTLRGSYTKTACPNNCENPNNIGGTTPAGGELTLYNQVDCGKECQSKTLTCKVNGEWNGYWGPDYKYMVCQRNATSCDKSYNISQGDKDPNAQYDETTCYTLDDSTCTQVHKYRFKQCNSGYTQVKENGKYVCKKNCDLPRGGSTGHKVRVTAYESPHQCSLNSTTCKSLTLTCSGGAWYDGNTPKSFGTYTSSSCTLQKNDCSAYPVSSTSVGCNYELCTKYTVNGGSCVKVNDQYMITSANDGYYSEDGKSCNAICAGSTCASAYTPRSTVGGTAWGKTFICDKKNSSTIGESSVTCNCDGIDVRNGTKCVRPSDLCNVSAKSCNYSYKDEEAPIADQSNSSVTAGYKWLCKNGNNPKGELCIKCENGYESNGTTCVKKTKNFKVYHYVPGLKTDRALSYTDDDKSGKIGETKNVSDYLRGKLSSILNYYGYKINGLNNTTAPINTQSTTFTLNDSFDHIQLYYTCETGYEFDGTNCVKPQLKIDKIENCKVYYHFTNQDPLSGKACCNPSRMEYAINSTSENNWHYIQLNYANGMKVFSDGVGPGMAFFRYTLDNGTTYSNITAVSLSKQSCPSTPGGGTSAGGTSAGGSTKVDWEGNEFNWQKQGNGTYSHRIYFKGYDGNIYYDTIYKKDCSSGLVDKNRNGVVTVGFCLESGMNTENIDLYIIGNSSGETRYKFRTDEKGKVISASRVASAYK